MSNTTPSPVGDIVALEGVTKRFPGIVANDSIDLSIRPGGPSVWAPDASIATATRMAARRTRVGSAASLTSRA